MRQLLPLMLRSANPSSPWPVAPCWPRNESASPAALQRGVAATGPVELVVVVGVVDGTLAVVLAVELVLWPAVTVVVLELPHADSVSPASTAAAALALMP